MANQEALWYRRFRAAAYASIVGLMGLTFIIVLPFRPFSYLPPIIVGGGPGEWLVLGYLLYAVLGSCGFGALSALLFALETHEGRRPDARMMAAALVLLFIGVTAACALLMLAGAMGGYSITIEGATTQATESTMAPYVYPVSLAALAAVLGAGLLVVGMTNAKAPSNE